MSDHAALLLLLQHGDSFFPGGGFASSWGLETLYADRALGDASSLGRFVTAHLRHRWASCDRPALLAAHRAGAALDRVAAVDGEVEALSLPRELREVSRRTGRALLRVHRRLGTALAASYLDRIKDGHGWGHLPVAQGLLWRSVGLDERASEAVSAHLAATALVSAAVRLGRVSHVAAQEVLHAAGAIAAALIREPPPEALSSFSPAADIAIMRHEVQPVRIFAN